MKQMVALFMFFLFIQPAFSQKNDSRHASTLGIHYTLQDFKNNVPYKNHKPEAGLSISYLKGINKYLDLQAGLGGSFPDSISKRTTLKESKYLFLQGDISGRIRFTESNKTLQPFIITGVGLAHYNKNISSYLLMGPGLEVKYKEAYITIMTQYRLSFTRNLNHHYFFSLGIAGLLSSPKKLIPKILEEQLPTVVQLDNDGDGTPDLLDACPDEAGASQYKGCPDSDGDGIIDIEDRCPTVPGLPIYHGCPDMDEDNDGIPDREDKCPNVPGTQQYQGCPIPDSDGDGINDEYDQCPDTPGTKELSGCPFISDSISQQIALAAKNIFFKTSSYELLPVSFTALDEIVAILHKNKMLLLTIEGHTDKTGNAKSNQLLSEQRANSVITYMIQKGIEKQRLRAIGYGMQKPVAANNSEEGRSRNRRVEIIINQ